MSHGLSLKAYDGAAALAIKNREAVVLFEFFILQVYGSFIAILQISVFFDRVVHLIIIRSIFNISDIGDGFLYMSGVCGNSDIKRFCKARRLNQRSITEVNSIGTVRRIVGCF